MRAPRISLFVVGVTVLALGVLLLPGNVQAQSADRPVGFGAKAAWNITKIRGEATADLGEVIDFKTGNGFSLGGLLSFAAGTNVTIQPEFIYSQKRVRADLDLLLEGDLILTADGDIDTDWFEIPVLAKFHGKRTQGARPFAMAGMTLSFLVNAKQTVSAMGVTETEDIKDELNGTDFGLTFGGGVDFLQSWGVFTVDARYTLGLRQLSDGDSIKQDTFSIGGGVIF